MLDFKSLIPVFSLQEKEFFEFLEIPYSIVDRNPKYPGVVKLDAK
jgi:hypothetical protein